MADVSILDVLLHGAPVGALTRVAGDRILFAWNDSYIGDEDRPTLGLAFKDAFGALITEFRPTQTRLLPWFSNLLPEEGLRTYLAERAGVNPAREFFLIWALGKDLPGAVTVRPADGNAWPADAAGAVEPRTGADRRDRAFRFSLAGVQLKFSAVDRPRRGLTIPAEGVGGSWIVKLPSREFTGVPENEFSMMTLARLIGMDVPPMKLVDPDEIANLPADVGRLPGKALAIRRFDRLAGGGAAHVEDFAQVFGVYPEQKYRRASYRNIAAVVAAETSLADAKELVRRLVFNTLIGNADMHLKNWSLLYADRRRPTLAPAYDFVATIAYIADANAALNYSRTRRFDEVTEEELSHLAYKTMLPQKLVLDTARETVALFHQHWKAEKKNLPLATKIIRAVEAHVKSLPIAALG
jgi:serine/threonine-protein kinase HipA